MTNITGLRARYTRLTRRERAVVAAATLVAIACLGYGLLIEPPLKKRALLERQIVAERSERDAFQLALAPGRKDPNAALRSQLDALQAQLRATDREFGEIQNGLVQPQHMGSLLQSLLTEHRGLKLIGLRTLPVSAAGQAGSEARKGTGDRTAGAALPTPPSTSILTSTASSIDASNTDDAWLFRHGVEIRVQGTYADMTAYLQAIENLPRRVHWGTLDIDARRYPASVMTVTIYTVSLERSWWVL